MSESSIQANLINNNFAKLARDLAINMVDIATIDDFEFQDAIGFLLKEAPEDDPKRRVRNILVVGSGASKDANLKIPTAYAVVNELFEQFVTSKELRKMKQIYEEREAAIHKDNSESFEFKLKTLEAILWDKNVRQLLRERLGYRHVPSLFYEIVGHMFKHRLIDVIINFNFDELLDTVIEEEMGIGHYFKILLNGHCPDDFDDLYLENKLAAPVYIKPHGTVSHPGSLKYTYEHYVDGNVTIKSLISDLLSDNHENEGSLEVNIIATGYSFNDPDLHRLIENAKGEFKEKVINFYLFDSKDRSEYIKNQNFLSDSDERVNYYRTDKLNLGDFFKNLWDLTVDQFKDDFFGKYPKGVERHEIIAGLFHRPKARYPVRSFMGLAENTLSNNNHAKEYFIKRIYVEIAMIIAQSQGLLHINQFKNTRLQNYINALNDIERNSLSTRSIDSFLRDFPFISPYMAVMRDTYQISRAAWNPSLKKVRIEVLLDALAGLIRNKDVARKRYHDLFEKVSQNTLCVVNSDIREFYLSPFKHLLRENLLYSDIRWLLMQGTQFKSGDWNVVLSISEKGDILSDDHYKINILKQARNAVVWAILADHSIDRRSNTTDQKNDKDFPDLNLRLLYLPWETHNKHMYVFLKVSNEGDVEFRFGIYYVRRLLAKVVNPVMLNHSHDVEVLFNYFCAYWYKAEVYNHSKTDDLGVNEAALLVIQKKIRDQLKVDAQTGAEGLKKWSLIAK